MKHKTKRIVPIVLALATMAATFVGCDGKANKCPVSLPDYSSTNYEFTLASSEPPAGWVKQNKVEYPIGDGRSYHTYEGFKQWRDLGLNTITIGHVYQTGISKDENWEGSEFKAICETAYSAGIKKMYLNDGGLRQFDQMSGVLVDPEVGVFKTDDELDAYVESRLAQYIHEPYVVGVQLADEPGYTEAPNLSALCRSVRRVATKLGYPEFEAFVNVYQVRADATYMPFGEPGSWTDVRQLYRDYLKMFFVDGNCTKICADDYPYHPNGMNKGFYASLQEVRRMADEYDMEMAYYATSFSELRFGGREHFFRAISQPELYHNFNSLLAFGVTHIEYFAYAPYPSGYNTGEHLKTWYDISVFVDRENRPTDLYYYGQQMFREYQGEFSNVYMNYDYQGTRFYFGDVPALGGINNYLGNAPDTSTGTVMDFVNTYNPGMIKSVEVDNELALIAEFKDKKNNLTMFEVMNPQDPYYSEYGRTDTKISLDFGSEYEWVAEYNRGKLTYVKLENGKYTKTLSAGYATYIIPLK